jgi:hypothetical protein
MFNVTSGQPDPKQGNTLIPNATLAKAVMKVQNIGNSKRTGAEYAKLDLVICEGEYTNRHIFTVVMNPHDKDGDKAAGAKMGEKNLCHMLEGTGLMDHTDPASTAQYDGASFQDVLGALDGKVVSIKIRVAPGKDGYDDKNEVAQYLSPVQASGSKRLWEQLHGATQAVAPVQKPAFTAQAKPAVITAVKPSSAPAWLKRPNA